MRQSDPGDDLGAGRVVVVDDNELLLRGIERHLRGAHLDVTACGTAREALDALAAGGADVLVTDIYMSGMSGFDLLGEVRERWPTVTPILMTGRADVASAVEGLRRGVYDYLVKPFELDTLLHAVRRAVERSRLLGRNLFIQQKLELADRVDGLVANSGKMRDVLALAATAAPTDATVLILGESGTGKELVARSIHKQSRRGARPFIGINCGALGETVLESELFGHARGAFTGAVVARRGLFEEASGGTLFLDEVGELSPATQVRLLRVLQEGEVRPVGSNQSVPIDVRIIAATNRQLRADVLAGRFRQDLFYRLEVITIEVPPLRERPEDLAPLVHHLVRKSSVRLGKAITGVDEAALSALTAHTWPGNVRELENAIERAIVMAKGDTLTFESLPPHLRGIAPVPTLEAQMELASFADARAAFERAYVQKVLERAAGNLSEAARRAGVDRSNFRRLVRRLGLEPPASGPVALAKKAAPSAE